MEKEKAFDSFNKIYSSYHENAEHRTESDMNRGIEIINRAIKSFDQKIVEFDYTLPRLEQSYIIFTVTCESKVNKAQKSLKPAEVQLFRLMLKRIVIDHSYCQTLIECINLVSGIQIGRITKSKAEILILKWIKDGYFRELNGNIYFGPRLVAEFIPYLQQHHKENIHTCYTCKTVVFWGPRCDHCQVMLHEICMKKYLARLKNCPACKQQWKAVSDSMEE